MTDTKRKAAQEAALAIADVLNIPGVWCQGDFARDQHGKPTDYYGQPPEEGVRSTGTGVEAMKQITVNGRIINVATEPMGYWGWLAYDDDRYDPGPDSGRWANLSGRGKTEAEAIDDLRDGLEDLTYEESHPF